MPESGDEEDSCLSFQEWKDCGWSVMKGQKANSFDLTGIAQFTRNQVTKINEVQPWRSYRR